MDRTSEETLFPWIEQVLQHGSAGEAFEELAARFRRDKQYRKLFDARLMQTRLQLGLPLVSTSRIGDVPKELQDAYQKGYLDAAREVGALLLADGNIPRAWPYFRAIGETSPVAHALDTFDPSDPNTPESHEALAATIQIAFQEGLHPRKGFELILKHYGLCRAITMFSGHPEGAGRHESVRLLVRSLHGQLVENLRRAIADVEGSAPESDSVTALIEGRDWLFANNAQHTDSSHIAPVLKFAAELEDTATLRLAVEIADYASHLDAMFQYADDPPFENTYTDHGVYLRILAGEDVDRGIAHFERKAAASDPDRDGHRPAEVLVELLIRLSRYGDAIKTFRRYLSDVAPEDLSCPPLARLCQMAGDFEQLKDVAKHQNDPLSYIAAIIQSDAERGKG
jgi:hypothetical protein